MLLIIHCAFHAFFTPAHNSCGSASKYAMKRKESESAKKEAKTAKVTELGQFISTRRLPPLPSLLSIPLSLTYTLSYLQREEGNKNNCSRKIILNVLHFVILAITFYRVSPPFSTPWASCGLFIIVFYLFCGLKNFLPISQALSSPLSLSCCVGFCFRFGNFVAAVCHEFCIYIYLFFWQLLPVLRQLHLLQVQHGMRVDRQLAIGETKGDRQKKTSDNKL